VPASVTMARGSGWLSWLDPPAFRRACWLTSSKELKRSPEPLDELPASRTVISDAVLQQFDDMKVTVELPVSDGGEPFVWEYLDIAKVLPAVVRASLALAVVLTHSLPSPRRVQGRGTSSWATMSLHLVIHYK
jgi:hypothetical protein